MGPCPSNRGGISCLFTDSFNQWMWLDSQLILPPLGGQADSITISGFSGGGSMAADMFTIYSDTIKGAGFIGSGPYGNIHWNVQGGLSSDEPDASTLASTAISLA